MQAVTSWADVAFSSAERDRHLGSRPVSQLNTWPVVSPVNASRRPSRDAVHHSGSGRMASPYPMGDFHLLFFASLPGALCSGSFSTEPASPADHAMSALARKQPRFGASRNDTKGQKQTHAPAKTASI